VLVSSIKADDLILNSGSFMDEFDLPPIPPIHAARMPRVAQASEFAFVGLDHLERDAFLTPRAAHAWERMKLAADADGVELVLVSAFRSVARQAAIVAGKLAKGMTLEQALEYSAYPGFSEHHSGNAVDIGTAGARHLEEEFESTPAFAWLCEHAADFGFSMTYPRNNPFGIAYEPWHWCFNASRLPSA
jgi:D-alanyl-D-alanine carboxypeptidase